MCRDAAHGGRRCVRTEPSPGSPASAAERALTRAEAVAEEARAAFVADSAAALDRLFTAVAAATTPVERTAAVRTWLDALAGAWHVVTHALSRAHERRVEALDARWRNRLGAELALVREARYAEERQALDHLHAAERRLDKEELLSRAPDWGDQLWRECQLADLEDLQCELAEERLRLHKLENRQARRPDPRVASEIRRGKARSECWRITLEGQRSRLGATPRTRAEADRRCAAAREDVEAARAALRAMSGEPADGLTGDERAYITTPDLVAAVEHSRQHPEQRRGRPVRA